MILEIQAEITGNIIIPPNMEVKINPYKLNIFQSNQDNKFYISVSKRMLEFKDYLPTQRKNDQGQLEIKFPPNDFYSDITRLLQHIESFGALDVGISKIYWEEPTVIWIPEKESEHLLSPVSNYKGKSKYENPPITISRDWLRDTVLHEKQMKDLYIPFSFYREGVNNYQEKRYQSAFIFFYMLLEYFFCNGQWGIKNYEYKRDTCLRSCLRKSLEILPAYKNHYSFLTTELENRHKEYDVEGLLFVLNRFRDELSHANRGDKNRNVFNETEYNSIAFIIMGVCLNVSIKKRLLPFVHESEKENFLNR